MNRIAFLTGAVAAVVAVSVFGGPASAAPAVHEGFKGSEPARAQGLDSSAHALAGRARSLCDAGFYGDFTGTDINIRERPGVGSSVWGTANRGDRLEYKHSARAEDGRLWDYVEDLANHKIGWVLDRYTNWDGDPYFCPA